MRLKIALDVIKDTAISERESDLLKDTTVFISISSGVTLCPSAALWRQSRDQFEHFLKTSEQQFLPLLSITDSKELLLLAQVQWVL